MRFGYSLRFYTTYITHLIASQFERSAIIVVEMSFARLLDSKCHLIPRKLKVSELIFEVPTDHLNPSSGTIQIFARSVTRHEKPVAIPSDEDQRKKPWFVYLQVRLIPILSCQFSVTSREPENCLKSRQQVIEVTCVCFWTALRLLVLMKLCLSELQY